jgi:hypothetical protein
VNHRDWHLGKIKRETHGLMGPFYGSFASSALRLI